VNLPSRWISQLLLLAAWLAATIFFGWWFGSISWGLVFGLGLYLSITLHNVYILDRVLRRGKYIPLKMNGLWAELFADIERLKTKSRKRKKRYHNLLREVRESTGALNDAGIILNSDYEIQWFNRAATNLIGLDPKTDIGQRIDNFLRHPSLVEHLNKPKEDILTIPSSKNDQRQLAIQIIPYGKSQQLAIIRDVTVDVAMQRMRRDFVANASHELRSPLTVISGYLDMLSEDEALRKDWENPIREMGRQTERMQYVLSDLLELSKLESLAHDRSPEPVDVVSMLKIITGEFADKNNVAKITLEIDTDAFLLGSEADLYSLFYNLIHNAIRFTPVDGKVLCSWKIVKQSVEFEVEDSGIGIPEDMISRVTERFFRVDQGRSRDLGGTGLGLAIVKHVLQTHGGTLEIASEVGTGSTFRCIFPEEKIVIKEDRL